MSNFSELVNGDQPVLIDFYADWCGPCKMLAPILKEVKQVVGEDLKIVKIDVDRNQQAASAFQVRGVPTMILFKEGKPVWRQSGVVEKGAIMAAIQPYL